MSNELNNLYHEIILDHHQHPRHVGKPSGVCEVQEGKNPVCGDRIVLYYSLDSESDGKRKVHVSFEGQGCAISQASTSIMMEAVEGKTLEEVLAIIKKAESLYMGETPAPQDDLDSDLDALSGVRKFPVRVKCAALAWKTLEAALFKKTAAQQESTPRKLKVITTEESD